MKKIVFTFLISLQAFAQNLDVTQVKYKFIPATQDVPLTKSQERCNEILKKEYTLFSFNKQKAKYENLGDIRLFDDIDYLLAQIYLGQTLIFDLENNNTYLFPLTSNPEFYFKFKTKIHNWVLTNESKIINGITCYKATLRIVTFNTNRDGSKKELIFDYDAWYAPSIPINVFFKEINGLPGLILELVSKNVGSLVAESIKHGVSVNKDYFTPNNNLYERTDYEEYISNSIKLINSVK